MHILTINSQNNNYSSRQFKPNFGMNFSEQAVDGIKSAEKILSDKVITALANLKSHFDTCTLTHFQAEGTQSTMGNRLYGCFITVEDQNGAIVYDKDITTFTKSGLSRKILRKLNYLLKDRFYTNVAKSDRSNKMKVASAEQASEERKRLLGYIAETSNPELMAKVLPDFAKLLGRTEEDARALISRLIANGQTDEKTLIETALETQPPTLEDKFKQLEVASG